MYIIIIIIIAFILTSYKYCNHYHYHLYQSIIIRIHPKGLRDHLAPSYNLSIIDYERISDVVYNYFKIKPFLYPQRVNCGKLLQQNTKLERMHV
jgi:hypothetical protein